MNLATIIVAFSFTQYVYCQLFYKRPHKIHAKSNPIKSFHFVKDETECLGACSYTPGCKVFNVFYDNNTYNLFHTMDAYVVEFNSSSMFIEASQVGKQKYSIKKAVLEKKNTSTQSTITTVKEVSEKKNVQSTVITVKTTAGSKSSSINMQKTASVLSANQNIDQTTDSSNQNIDQTTDSLNQTTKTTTLSATTRQNKDRTTTEPKSPKVSTKIPKRLPATENTTKNPSTEKALSSTNSLRTKCISGTRFHLKNNSRYLVFKENTLVEMEENDDCAKFYLIGRRLILVLSTTTSPHPNTGKTRKYCYSVTNPSVLTVCTTCDNDKCKRVESLKRDNTIQINGDIKGTYEIYCI